MQRAEGELSRDIWGEGAVQREERQGGLCVSKVLAPREALWRPPGKKRLVLARREGGAENSLQGSGPTESPFQGQSQVQLGGGKGGNQVLG